jgi:hypothetical protein
MDLGQMGAVDPALRERIRQELYIKILNRDPLATGDAEGLDYWAGQMEAMGWNWDTLVRQFLLSAQTVLSTSTDAQRTFLAPAVFAPAAGAAPVSVASGSTVEKILATIAAGSTPAVVAPVASVAPHHFGKWLLLAGAAFVLLRR